jgi:hypothetical protein
MPGKALMRPDATMDNDIIPVMHELSLIKLTV